MPVVIRVVVGGAEKMEASVLVTVWCRPLEAVH